MKTPKAATKNGSKKIKTNPIKFAVLSPIFKRGKPITLGNIFVLLSWFAVKPKTLKTNSPLAN